MKVAVYHTNSDVRVEERAAPSIAEDEILVKVESVGICGSDVMEWYRAKKAPLVLGHEIAGVVEKVGAKIEQSYELGDRVFVPHHVPCGKCHYCALGHSSVCETLRTTHVDPGGFSQFIRVPAQNVAGMMVLPNSMSFDQAAFIEPVGCCFHGLNQTRIKSGQSVFIIGSGLSGLLHLQTARIKGAKKVFTSDIDEFRLAKAKELGADGVFLATHDIVKELRTANDGRLADIVIVTTGAEAALKQAMTLVERGGTILYFAPSSPGTSVTFDLNQFWKDEITITHSYAATKYDLVDALQNIRIKKVLVDSLITHTLPLSEIQKGFDLTAHPKNSLKVIVHPNQ